MPENNINNNILKSDKGIIYIDNMSIVKNTTNTFLKPNQILVSSYNYDFIKNIKHKGTSYELFYSDNDSNLHQLTYFIGEGNGLYINDSYNLNINIDNTTIKENENHELYIDDNELTYAFNDQTKGILGGDSRLFYDHDLINSGFVVSNNGELKLSTGLLMSLYEIQNYYDEFNKILSEINKITIKLDITIDTFNIGDILYKDKDGQYTKIKDGNTPIMVCVIGSNILNDGYARFIPLKKNVYQSIVSLSNNNIYYNKLFDSVPVYEDDLNMITKDSKITSNDYGYIATDNSYWAQNFRNPFNYKEHFYANSYTLKNDIIWYIDSDKCHQSDKYSLDPKSIVTESVYFNNLNIDNNNLYPIVEIEFNDGFKAYYMLVFEYSATSKKYELSEISLPILNSILLINKLNSLFNNTNSKIKYNKEETIIDSEEFITKFNIIQNDESLINKVKFENDNANNIDYKILVESLKNNSTNTNNVSSTNYNIYNKDDLYELDTQTIINKDINVSTLSKTNGIIESNTNVYIYRLIIDQEVCDRQYAYLIIQLGDNNRNITDNIYIKYNSNTGLDYVFTNYQSTINTGFMKITAYASSEYYDKNPISLGIISVNEYQGSFKIVHLTKEHFSFNFNDSTIIPIKARLYKNYSILSLIENATILPSNNYDDYLNSYDYSLDLNYYAINSESNNQNKYDIISGGIKIFYNDIDKFKFDFINNVYYAHLIIRNGLGYTTSGKFKFIKKQKYLELVENIPIHDLQNINKIIIYAIEDKNGNNINVIFKESGQLINKINDWIELNPLLINM